MGNIASIHFKPTKLSIQEKHNDRSVKPSYVLKSGGLGVECNRNAQEARAFRDSLVKQAKINYERCFNQPFKSTSYLRSAVVNIKPEHTMQDLEMLALRLQKRFKFQCYQIAIHRDEGHIDEKGIEHINHHAHLEFVTLHPKTGKSMYRRGYINYKTGSYMQNLTAKVLRMERGKHKYNVYDYQGNIIIKGTGRKRIEPRAYAQIQEKAKAERAKLKGELSDAVEHQDFLIDSLSYVNISVAGFLGTETITTLEAIFQDVLVKIKHHPFEEHVKTQVETCLNYFGDQIKALSNDNKALGQENKQLRQDNQELENAIIDLASVVDDEKKPSLHLDKKLTTKDLTTICGNVRKYMISVNAKFEELKLYTQKIYMAVNALKQQKLTLAELKTKLVAIDNQAKADYEALKTQSKGYLSPTQVQDKINATKAQYNGYLSPDEAKTLKEQANTATQTLAHERKARQDEIKGFCKELRQAIAGKGFKREHFSQLEQWAKQAQDQAIDFAEFQRVALGIFGDCGAVFAKDNGYLSPNEVEAIRLKDLKSLCSLAFIESKDTAQESLATLKKGIEQNNTNLTALCERAGGGKWLTPSKAKEHLEKGIDNLKGAKTELEQQLKARDEAHAKAIKVKDGSIGILTTEKENAEQEASKAIQISATLETAINTLYTAWIEAKEQNSKLTAQDKLEAIKAKGQEWQNTISTQQSTMGAQTKTINAQKEKIQELNAQLANKPQAVVQDKPTSQAPIAKGTEKNIKSTETPIESKQEQKQVNTAPNGSNAEYETLKAQNERMAQESASLWAQIAIFASTAHMEDLARLENHFYTSIALFTKIDPEKADELITRFGMALKDFTELMQELPKPETFKQMLQEQAQKGSGGKHI
ncbi:hypothetical protein [Helicobacter ailurogastricus]|uniref:Mobilization protein n=1 Tax=Helicobacter ailurogastricus TaxID=1578720 RepID=A0A0K2XEU5_9HELI|nr:hypothetical protein [Helicobacter ailurogastricus]CRF40959.1 hypothetical protein HAL011_07350 [Helicobacter ailurogastricus]CRF42366.1 hypothetical protein HAL013_05360 [Helicobacter ailurogastricus]CRF44621.1 hypothetical protein HAL09_12150 [Helicobacter ailurogastricus]